MARGVVVGGSVTAGVVVGGVVVGGSVTTTTQLKEELWSAA